MSERRKQDQAKEMRVAYQNMTLLQTAISIEDIFLKDKLLAKSQRQLKVFRSTWRKPEKDYEEYPKKQPNIHLVPEKQVSRREFHSSLMRGKSCRNADAKVEFRTGEEGQGKK